MRRRLYRILCAVHRNWGLGIFWLYLGLFVLTFSLVFVLPPAALALVFLGLSGLVVAAGMGWLLSWARAAMARSLLRRGTCPACLGALGAGEVHDATWCCEHCGATSIDALAGDSGPAPLASRR